MSEDHEARITRNEEDIQKIDGHNIPELWKAIDDIKKAMTYRLPLWAVGVFGVMCSAITWLARN